MSEVKDAFRDFGSEVPRHLGVGHMDANASRMGYRSQEGLTKLVSGKAHYHLPGYGGFVPGTYARNAYGRTFFKASDMALRAFEEAQAALPRPITAPERPPVFKSFVSTLRIQGGADAGLSARARRPTPARQCLPPLFARSG